jgi:hypothetical protein
MGKLLERKIVQLALVIALILIWGYNSYSIMGITQKDEIMGSSENSMNFDTTGLEVPEARHFGYKANFRDPFAPQLAKTGHKKAKDPPKKTIQKVKIPSLKLTGVIDRMALIQNRNKKLAFVSEGDTVAGARVRFVTEDSVGLTFRKKEFNLKMHN